MSLKIVYTLEEFSTLSQDERKKVYLDEAASSLIPMPVNDEECIDLDALFANAGVVVYHWEKGRHLYRKGAAERLLKAAQSLPEGVLFKLYTTIRPKARQQELFDEVSAKVKAENPQFTPKEVWSEVTKLVADPEGCPPHMTGCAIDLTLCDKEGNELDMGGEINALYDTTKNDTYSEGLSEVGAKNRDIMIRALEAQGFANLPTEWWHFSYGDQYWAAVQNEKEAIYGKCKEADLPLEPGRLYS